MHIAQLVGGYRYFDYGEVKNLEIYKQVTPPYYPVQNIINRNIAIIYGLNDYSSIEDLEQLRSSLKGI